MTISEELLAELEQQAPVTRKFLERIPEDKLMWRPHPKSMTAGELGMHLATVPGGIAGFVQTTPAQVPGFNRLPQPASVAEMVTALGESVATAKRLLAGMDDDTMQATWHLMAGEREVLAVPRRHFVRDVMLSHWYQHRGQLSVYLRLLDVAVPASWGPSGDEPPQFGSFGLAKTQPAV